MMWINLVISTKPLFFVGQISLNTFYKPLEMISTQRFITFPWFFRDCSAAKTSLWELKDPSTPVPIWWDFPSAIDLTKAFIRKKSAPSCPPVFTYNRKFLIKSNSYLGFGDFFNIWYIFQHLILIILTGGAYMSGLMYLGVACPDLSCSLKIVNTRSFLADPSHLIHDKSVVNML